MRKDKASQRLRYAECTGYRGTHRLESSSSSRSCKVQLRAGAQRWPRREKTALRANPSLETDTRSTRPGPAPTGCWPGPESRTQPYADVTRKQGYSQSGISHGWRHPHYLTWSHGIFQAQPPMATCSGDRSLFETPTPLTGQGFSGLLQGQTFAGQGPHDSWSPQGPNRFLMGVKLCSLKNSEIQP